MSMAEEFAVEGEKVEFRSRRILDDMYDDFNGLGGDGLPIELRLSGYKDEVHGWDQGCDGHKTKGGFEIQDSRLERGKRMPEYQDAAQVSTV